MMNSPLHPDWCVWMCSVCPLVGVLAGTRDPSEIGISAASEINDRRRGGAGILARPLSFLSMSGKAGLGPKLL